ncbi:HEPN domain protein [uncultured archaeon]|nr:HEPN domain protein [uncultured archaeon]
MREIVREWIKKGESDFVAAKTLSLQKGLENQTGFHCQQAIEKWLKAFLIEKGEEIRKIHDLMALVIDCEKYDPDFHEIEPLVDGISDFAVEFRYPGENATPEEAKDALNKTIKIRDFLLKKIEYEEKS